MLPAPFSAFFDSCFVLIMQVALLALKWFLLVFHTVLLLNLAALKLCYRNFFVLSSTGAFSERF